MTIEESLSPGSTIGILGGGQLGRMLAMAAAEFGFRVHIFTPPGDTPACDVAQSATLAPWDDDSALEDFARSVDIVTYEFENIPRATAHLVSSHAPLRPSIEALLTAQDRLSEKRLMDSLGIAVAPYRVIDSLADLEQALNAVPPPAILKTRRLGYDGKGQAAIARVQDAATAWEAIGKVPSLLEGRIAFDREISVLMARGTDGAVVPFDIPENVHHRGILHTSTVPADVSAKVKTDAIQIAGKIAARLDYVGVLAVELFVVRGDDDNQLLVNEIAPRVHNSGHWTSDACVVSQFEQHIRAICGWPLAEPARHSDVAMTNLIGADIDRWRDIAAEPGAHLHLYGKADARDGRKMGHVNRINAAR